MPKLRLSDALKPLLNQLSDLTREPKNAPRWARTVCASADELGHSQQHDLACVWVDRAIRTNLAAFLENGKVPGVLLIRSLSRVVDMDSAKSAHVVLSHLAREQFSTPDVRVAIASTAVANGELLKGAPLRRVCLNCILSALACDNTTEHVRMMSDIVQKCGIH